MKNILRSGEDFLAKIQGKKVLIVGDLMIDQYIWGEVSRVSPEAPVPVVGVNRETLRLGGAANVVNNIVSLGGKAEICGVVGDDQMGRWVVRDLKKRGVGVRGVILNRGRPTTKKTRVIAHNQQVVRFDREVTNALSREDEKVVCDSVRALIRECGALVLSDYAKGVITPTLVRDVVAMAKKAGIPVAVDPKINHFGMYRGVTVLTPNLFEASAGAGMIISSLDDLEGAGRAIIEKLGCPYLIITRGDQGMTLFPKGGESDHFPAVSREVYDVTGAGDTVVATIALALAAGISMRDSAWLANVAAGVAVGEVGTVSVSREQMRSRFIELMAADG